MGHGKRRREMQSLGRQRKNGLFPTIPPPTGCVVKRSARAIGRPEFDLGLTILFSSYIFSNTGAKSSHNQLTTR